MRKLSGKAGIGAAAVLLAGMLAAAGCKTAAETTPLTAQREEETDRTPAEDAEGAQGGGEETGATPEPAEDAGNGNGEEETGATPEPAEDAGNGNGGEENDGTESGAPDYDYEGLTPADFTIRVADNAGTQSRGTAGEILATGGDMKAISRVNVIFYFTDEFKERVKEKNDKLKEEGRISDTAGIVLGAADNIYDIELWIADECIYTGNLKKYLSYDGSGFMAWKSLSDWPYYGELTLMDDMGEGPMGYREAAAKLHAFAKASGLEQERNPIEVTETGWCSTEQEYLADLDGDGVQESFFYGQSTLLIDGVNYFGQMRYRDEPDPEGFFLWDIDTADAYKEIAIWNHGPSSDDYADVYYYDGETLRYAGFLQGSPEEVILDGNGAARAKCRLGILQTWYAYKEFCLDEGHELELVEQELYYTEKFGEEEYRYTVLQPIRLYEAMDENGAYTVLEAGVRMEFPATDNECFVQVVTQDGREGFLYLAEGGFMETLDGEARRAEELIDGLNFAD